jgi:biopolymer transport protein ExbB
MNLLNLILSGGFTMIPLLICSLVTWGVVFERYWSYRRLKSDLQSFHLEAMNLLLKGDSLGLTSHCQRNAELPLSKILSAALERMNAKDPRVQSKWQEAMERRRLIENQELKKNFWLLGTIGSASPFIGLFGTVVGILIAFQEMAKSGSGGFAVVAAGISEALVATAAGIVVAVVAVMFFNAFQTRWQGVVLTIKLQVEELAEILSSQ